MVRPKREAEKPEDLVWKDLLPFLVLAIIDKEPMHGYGIKKKILEMSKAKMGATTIYAVIYSLSRLGMIEGSWKKRRKVYKLTDKGKKALELARKALRENLF